MTLMSRKNKTPFTILGMLATRPMTGYDIRKAIKETTSNIWSESLGQIYPTLAALLKNGEIAEIKLQSINNRNCRKYKITTKGLQTLQTWFTQPTEHPVYRDELMLKLFFGKNATKDQRLALVNNRRENLLKDLNYLTKVKKHIETEHSKEAAAPFWLITINSGVLTTQAALKWCDETIAILNKSR